MSNGLEQTVDGEVGDLTSFRILGAEAVYEVTITCGFDRNGIPQDSLRAGISIEK